MSQSGSLPRPSADRPVVVIGAGPIGLAAAANLAVRDIPFVVLESGHEVASHVRSWGHVRLFSQWRELVDPAAEKLLAPTGWSSPPADAYPDGAEWVAAYLDPLAEALGDRVRLRSRVTAISRQGLDLMSDRGRDQRPLVVRVEGPGGRERLLAAAVIDASGTLGSPNPLGADGLPADGEREHATRIVQGAPDLADQAVRARHASAHTVVVGAGHTAMTALVSLGRLAEDAPGTRVTWVRRGAMTEDAFGGGDADQLAARGALGQAAAAAVRSGAVQVAAGFRIVGLAEDDRGRLRLSAEDGRTIDGVDVLVAATGYRPDLSITSELRLDLDPSVQAPSRLAPLIDPNVHSCGSVPPHGESELAHPEPGLYTVGMKSYGRAPTFLAMTGYEQVRSVVAKLAGDDAAAGEVRLVLPETGLCGGSGLDESATAAPT